MTSVLEALLVVTVGAEFVVVTAVVWQSAVVAAGGVAGVVGMVSVGPTALTVVVPEGPTVVIALEAVLVEVAGKAVVIAVKHGGEAAGGSIEPPLISPAAAMPADPSASRDTAASTRRATRPR